MIFLFTTFLYNLTITIYDGPKRFCPTKMKWSARRKLSAIIQPWWTSWM